MALRSTIAELARRGPLVAAAFVVLALYGAGGAYAEARLEAIDSSKFEETARLQFFVDAVTSARDVVLPSQVAPASIQLFADGRPVPETKPVRVTSFAEQNYAVSVLIIVPAHNDYQIAAGMGEEAVSSFDHAVKGMRTFVQQLGPADRVAAYCYSEADALESVSSFQPASSETARVLEESARTQCSIEVAARRNEGSDDAAIMAAAAAPKLYEWLDESLSPNGPISKQLEGETNTQRTIILMMSDGIDVNVKLPNGQDTINGRIDSIARNAAEAGVEIWVIGYDGLAGTYFANLDLLASRTSGVWERMSDDALGPQIEDAWRRLATRLRGQLIFDIEAPLLAPSDGKPVPLYLEFKASEVAYKTNPLPARIAERSTNWLEILKWVGIGLGGLFVLVLFFILILRRIQNPRPKEVVVHQEIVSEPGGPARGKLLLTKGPGAGETFFLTEEVTTIGRMDGNHIVIDDPSVSKRHAGIRVKDLRFEIADLGAANGVMVNGRQITKQFLRDGDAIRVGDTEMTFHLK